MKKTADKLAKKLAENQKLSHDEEEVISYGIQAFSQMVIIFLVAFLIGCIINTPLEVITIYLTVGIFRKFTGGVHGNSMLQCIIVSVISITGMSFIASIISKNQISFEYSVLIVAISLCYASIITFIKAPVDSENKPITNKNKIKRLRKASFIFISTVILVIIILYIANLLYNNKILMSIIYSLMLSMIWQSSTLLPKKKAIPS